MKIAVSSKGAGLGAWMEAELNQCGFLMIVDEAGDFSAIENPACHEAAQNEITLAEAAIAQGVGALIAGSVGTAAQKLLRENGIGIYYAQSGSILELVEQYTDGKLAAMD
jgi:predicted Fe-Mo cluster-binding NifX family protein